MKLGVVIGDNDNFYHDIGQRLSADYETTEFRPVQVKSPVIGARINRFLLRRDLHAFMRRQDVVFFEWASHYLEIASRLPKSSRIVTRLLGYELYDWAPRIAWDRVDRVIVLLQTVKEWFGELYPACRGKTVVVHQGVRLDQFRPHPVAPGPRLRLGALGYLTPRKRAYELVLALSELVERGCDCELHIAGQAVNRFARDNAALRRLPRKLGLEDRVFFEGYVPEAAEWYPSIDIFVSNSYWETQHLALQEAMASGVCCLSHFWDGVGEFLPGRYLFGTNTDLCNKIMTYWSSSADEKQRIRAEMRSIAEREFDIGETIRQIEDTITDPRRS